VKILHTADWHVGKTIQGRSRAEEHQAVLSELTDIAQRESVDLVLVAGDLFDTSAPAPEAERIVYRGLLALAEVAPVVAIPGNHDSDRRLAALTPLFDLARVTIRAGVAKEAVEIDTASGELARIACIPWLSQRYIVKAAHLMDEDAAQSRARYEERMALVVDSLTAGFTPDAVNIVMAHLAIVGAAFGGGERTAQTIFEYWVNSTLFPAHAHYVALGHLHKAQAVIGPCPIHYPGSPLQLDFGETDMNRCALVVEATPGTPATARAVELTGGRRLRTLRGKLSDLAPLAGTTGDDYLRVVLTEKARIGLGDEVREMFPHAVKVTVEQEATGGDGRTQVDRTSLTPHELFVAYLNEKDVEDESLVALFDTLYEEAHAPQTT
jgi:DNA repair protein SbcD/Mre11